MMDKATFEELVRSVKTTERDMIEAAATMALEAVKSVGAVSVMANPSLPTNGMLLMVHPKVYDRLRQLTEHSASDATECPACGGSGRIGPFFPGGLSTLCANCTHTEPNGGSNG